MGLTQKKISKLLQTRCHANTNFATEISDIQDNVNMSINQLVNIIAEVEGEEFVPSDYYIFQLIPPVVLILQLIEMTMSSIGNIFGIFQSANINFDPYYFLDKYVPYIDWTDFKTKSEDYLRKVNTKAGVETVGSDLPQ